MASHGCRCMHAPVCDLVAEGALQVPLRRPVCLRSCTRAIGPRQAGLVCPGREGRRQRVLRRGRRGAMPRAVKLLTLAPSLTLLLLLLPRLSAVPELRRSLLHGRLCQTRILVSSQWHRRRQERNDAGGC